MNDYIIFTVSGNYYALQVASIQRIIQVPSLTPIPNSHPFIDGMMSYENKVSKVVDFRAMMGLELFEEDLRRDKSQKSQKLLIYQTKENLFGIKVDQIEDIVSLDPSMLKHLDRHEYGSSFVELEGVVELSERLVNVIKSVSMPVKE